MTPELAGYSAAVTAIAWMSPGDDGAISLECREGMSSGEDLADTRGELAGHPTAVATPGDVAPGDDRAILLECRKSVTG